MPLFSGLGQEWLSEQTQIVNANVNQRKAPPILYTIVRCE